jgi:FAD/FMN-containing dehydrogenase
MILKPSEIDQLRTRFRGPVLGPGDAGYDDARSIWNAMIDRCPAAIVRCLGVADVIAGVNFARESGIPLSIKGGGHNISGLAVGDDCLMLDMSLMRGVFVDREKKIAHAQAGCLLGDVDRETQIHGLAAVMGFVSMTGVAGLTLGGGMGYLSRRFGWTSDNVRSMEVVTADGRVVPASEKENDDLFWALRGGGGNFGVVTRFEYQLYPVGPEIVGGAIAWRAEDAPAVLEMYRDITRDAPDELTCVVAMRNAPPAPWIAKESHGKPIIALFVCYSGSIADGEKLVAPIKAFGSAVGDILMRRSYISQQSLLDATQPKGRRYYWKSEYLSDVDADLLAGFMQHASLIRSPHSAIILFPIGGKLNKVSLGHSSAGNRDARVLLNIASSWEKSADDEENIEWARAAWRDLRRFSTGGTYINFLTEEEGSDRIHAAYGANYDRLAELKGKWDPSNLFNQNKNIAPVTV